MNASFKACFAIGISCVIVLNSRVEAVVTLEWSNDGSTLFGGNILDPGLINTAAATSKPGTLNEYFFPADGYMVQVMTRNMNRFQSSTVNAVYMEGQQGTIQSTIRMRFYEYTDPGSGFVIGAPIALNDIHFTLDDAESSEWLYNFGIYDLATATAAGYQPDINVQTAPSILIPFTSPVFTFSGNGGTPLLKDGNVNYASNDEPLVGGTQLGKTVDVELLSTNVGDVYGFEFSLRRNSSSPGGVIMQFQAPEPSSMLLVAVGGVGLLLRRRRG